ncbi:hypothetical protein PUR35_00095, partial [Streptomyces sp. JV184]
MLGLPRPSSGAGHRGGEPVASGLAGQDSVVDEGTPQRDGVQHAARAPRLQAVGDRPLVVVVADGVGAPGDVPEDRATGGGVLLR